MSTAEILSLISLIAYIIAGVSLVVSIVLWFVFKIPTVFGDLSGRTARKSIAQMRANNEKTGDKSFKSSKTNAERGKLTESIDNKKKKKDSNSEENPETKLLSDNRARTKKDSDPTELLNEATGKLYDESTTALLSDDGATSLLNEDNVTTLLTPTRVRAVKRTGGKSLVMLDEVMLIHTEVII